MTNLNRLCAVPDLVRTRSDPRGPLLLRAGPPIFGPDTQTFRVGPGRTSGQGPPALPMDSLETTANVDRTTQGCRVHTQLIQAGGARQKTVTRRLQRKTIT